MAELLYWIVPNGVSSQTTIKCIILDYPTNLLHYSNLCYEPVPSGLSRRLL